MIDIYKFIGKVYTRKLYNRETVQGIENLPATGPYIIAANHVGSLETIAIPNLIYNHRNEQRIKSLTIGWLCNLLGKKISDNLGFIPVHKENKTHCLDLAIEELKQGNIISIFPEGTRAPRGNKQTLLQGKTGVARLAILAQVPVVPLGYRGPVDNNMFMILKHWFFSKQKVDIKIGQLMNFKEYYNLELTKELLRTVTNKIMKKIAQLSRQSYDYN